jgi:hypothetical protein
MVAEIESHSHQSVRAIQPGVGLIIFGIIWIVGPRVSCRHVVNTRIALALRDRLLPDTCETSNCAAAAFAFAGSMSSQPVVECARVKRIRRLVI